MDRKVAALGLVAASAFALTPLRAGFAVLPADARSDQVASMTASPACRTAAFQSLPNTPTPTYRLMISHAETRRSITPGGAVTLCVTVTTLGICGTSTCPTRPVVGVTIKLQRRTGPSWTNAQTRTTDPQGSASVTFQPAATATYRWYLAPSALGRHHSVSTAAFTISVAAHALTTAVPNTGG